MPFKNDTWQGWRREGGGGAGVKWRGLSCQGPWEESAHGDIGIRSHRRAFRGRLMVRAGRVWSAPGPSAYVRLHAGTVRLGAAGVKGRAGSHQTVCWLPKVRAQRA